MRNLSTWALQKEALVMSDETAQWRWEMAQKDTSSPAEVNLHGEGRDHWWLRKGSWVRVCGACPEGLVRDPPIQLSQTRENSGGGHLTRETVLLLGTA